MIDRAVLEVRRLDPERQRERLEAVEVAQGERDVVLAAEPQALADPPLDELGVLRRLAGLLGSARLATLPPSIASSGKSPIRPGDDGLAAAFGDSSQASNACARARRARRSSSASAVADLRLGRGDRAVAVGRRQEQRRRRRRRR